MSYNDVLWGLGSIHTVPGPILVMAISMTIIIVEHYEITVHNIMWFDV